MRTAPKIALSILISAVLFSALAVAAYAGLFNVVETRFYQPTVIETLKARVAGTGAAIEEWNNANVAKFAQFVESEAVKRSLLPNQSSQDIFDRTNLSGSLMAETGGLLGIRIIDAGDPAIPEENDKGTRRIHFSTFKEDILKQTEFQIFYEQYGKSGNQLPARLVASADGDPPRTIADPERDVFVYTYPFYDAYATWRGSAVFYVSASSAARYLYGKSILGISDDLSMIASDDHSVCGVVIGLPRAGSDIIKQAILDRWSRKNFETERIVSTEDSGWVLMSTATSCGNIGMVVPENLFVFPQPIRILFLTISFITIFLAVFLLFNLKQDEMIRVRNRVRRFQLHILSELMEKNDDQQWEELRSKLKYRKHDLTAEIKKGFGKRMNRKHGSEIDSILERSWEEIFSALGKQEKRQSALPNSDEIRSILEQVLQNSPLSINLTGVQAAQSPEPALPGKNKAKKAPPPATPALPASAANKVEAEEVEELEEVEDLDEPEAVEELAETVEEVEELEDLEEIEEAEAVDELEEAAEAVEDLDETEAVDEAVEEIEEVEELEEIVEEVEETEDLEEIEEAEAVEELEEAAEAVEDLDEPEPVEDLEEIEDLEEVEEIEEAVKEAPAEAEEPETGTDLERIEEILSAEDDVPADIACEFAEIEDSPVKGTGSAGDDLDDLELTLDDLDGEGHSELEKLLAAAEPLAAEEETDLAEAPAEPEEVEYLDGEWEPELLEVASDEELDQFVETSVPDEVLVYNFDERAALDTGRRPAEPLHETELEESLTIASLDFSSLDSTEEEEGTEVEYIESLIFDTCARQRPGLNESPVFELLEVIGEEEPDELIPIDETDSEEESAIVTEDGLFLIAEGTRSREVEIDPEFRDLVNSVLL